MAASKEDLEKLSNSDDFSDIEELSTPGGGYVTKAMDPDGIGVEVVFGIEERSDFSEVSPYPTNEGTNINRVNQIKRYPKGSYPKIIRFAHYGINSNKLGDQNSSIKNFPRQALHAQKIKFDHPITGEHIALESELPKDILNLEKEIIQNE